MISTESFHLENPAFTFGQPPMTTTTFAAPPQHMITTMDVPSPTVSHTVSSYPTGNVSPAFGLPQTQVFDSVHSVHHVQQRDVPIIVTVPPATQVQSFTHFQGFQMSNNLGRSTPYPAIFSSYAEYNKARPF
jgi:hypothetical protein